MTSQPLQILEWLTEMGDDLPLADQPINRFDESAKAAQAKSEKSKVQNSATNRIRSTEGGSIQERVAAIKEKAKERAPTKSEAVLPDETVIAAANAVAKDAKSLDALKEQIFAFKSCNLRLNAKNPVFAAGDPASKIMLIDEHPGREEDLSGEPFAGASGALLEKMLSAIGLNLQDVYRAAPLPWHPPGNRAPTPSELEICRPFLRKHIELVRPEFVIGMGNTSARMLFQSNAQVLTLRGKWSELEMGESKQQCLITLHPNFLIKQPAQKRLAWQDLLAIKNKLKNGDAD